MSKGSRRANLLLGAVASVVALTSAAPPAGADPDKALAEARVKLAREALENLKDLEGSIQGIEKIDRLVALRKLDQIALWERRLVEALRGAGAEKGELVAALEGQLRRRQRLAEALEELMKGEPSLLTRMDLIDAKYEAIEAEARLNRERAR